MTEGEASEWGNEHKKLKNGQLKLEINCCMLSGYQKSFKFE